MVEIMADLNRLAGQWFPADTDTGTDTDFEVHLARIEASGHPRFPVVQGGLDHVLA